MELRRKTAESARLRQELHSYEEEKQRLARSIAPPQEKKAEEAPPGSHSLLSDPPSDPPSDPRELDARMAAIDLVLERLDGIDRNIREQGRRAEKAQREHETVVLAVQSAQHRAANTEKEIARLESERTHCLETLKSQGDDLLAELDVYEPGIRGCEGGIVKNTVEHTVEKVSGLLDTLERRREEWLARQRRFEEVNPALSAQSALIEEKTARLTEWEHRATELREQRRMLRQRIAAFLESHTKEQAATSPAADSEPSEPTVSASTEFETIWKPVLTEMLSREKAAWKDMLRQTGILEEKLEHDRENRARRDRAGESLAKTAETVREWSRLNDLIGQADGQKYRNFVQHITFDMLLERANVQLAKLTDRYLLERLDAEELRMRIIDTYQGGAVRGTDNLSGGESFLVSLALALALSDFSARNVPVDSLFLDEGFGTLDEETLETALSMLVELRREGKMIGVISHVPALKERIATRIEVIPQTGGCSILQGPGVWREDR
ncbi:MAG TPA: hypothetical protein DEB39_15495 [Planctomycetaceae bacterium]|nr:hypothetical protein [Planctomycetaceae bacterium]